jgi:hypothetical protein
MSKLLPDIAFLAGARALSTALDPLLPIAGYRIKPVRLGDALLGFH